MIWSTDCVMPGLPCQGVPGVSPAGAAIAVRRRKRTSEKLELTRILADLFIVLIHLARAGRVEHSNNCEPTIAEAFGTGSFVTLSVEKSKPRHFQISRLSRLGHNFAFMLAANLLTRRFYSF